MPYQDGTGPHGDGSPGRGLGICGKFIKTLSGNRGQGNSTLQRNSWLGIAGIIVYLISKLLIGGNNAKS